VSGRALSKQMMKKNRGDVTFMTHIGIGPHGPTAPSNDSRLPILGGLVLEGLAL
jgi:hypothetical protein